MIAADPGFALDAALAHGFEVPDRRLAAAVDAPAVERLLREAVLVSTDLERLNRVRSARRTLAENGPAEVRSNSELSRNGDVLRDLIVAGNARGCARLRGDGSGAICAGCGVVSPLGALPAYTDAPGLVLRCGSCDRLQLRLVVGRGRSWLHLSGVRPIEPRR